MYPSSPLRLCTSCAIAHYENCPSCFGFGVYGDTTERPLPVSAAKAMGDDAIPASARACPTCGSTAKGPPPSDFVVHPECAEAYGVTRHLFAFGKPRCLCGEVAAPPPLARRLVP